jgi:hypothetical protein
LGFCNGACDLLEQQPTIVAKNSTSLKKIGFHKKTAVGGFFMFVPTPNLKLVPWAH